MPQGPKGDTGSQGPQGPIGLTGPKGDTGATGPQGLKGDKGDIGLTGPKGDKGDQGPAGPAGSGSSGTTNELYASITLGGITNAANGGAYTLTAIKNGAVIDTGKHFVENFIKQVIPTFTLPASGSETALVYPTSKKAYIFNDLNGTSKALITAVKVDGEYVEFRVDGIANSEFDLKNDKSDS